jgi:hypothetical protein
MIQQALPFSRDEGSLKKLFEEAAGKRVSLTITDNSTSLLSIRPQHTGVSVRLHRIFLQAGDDVIGEIASFIKKRNMKTPLIRDFIRHNSGCIRKREFKKRIVKTLGNYFDLSGLYRSINEEYFGGRISAEITWGEKGPGYAVRKRTLGSYNSHSRTIRINPVLDKKTVPLYFMEFIVYHEMLHAGMGVEMKNGRRRVHTREFRRRERLFRHYNEALEWEKKNL